jgi:DNA repair protein RadC
MLLTRSNKVLGIASISKGGINGTVAVVVIILQFAIKANASGIIISYLLDYQKKSVKYFRRRFS